MDIQLTLKSRGHAQQMANTKQALVFLEMPLVSSCFVWALLTLLVFCLYAMASNFVFLWCLLVRMCMSLHVYVSHGFSLFLTSWLIGWLVVGWWLVFNLSVF